MNLTQMEVRLRASLGNLEEAQVPRTTLIEHLNTAYEFMLDRYLQKHGRAWFTFTTVSGTANYNIPNNFGAILKVYDQERRSALLILGKDEVPAWDDVPNARPVRFGHWAQELTLYPTPDDAYTIGVQAKITYDPLVNDSDTPVLDRTWHDGIVKRARYEYYDAIGDLTKAQQSLGSFQEWVSNKTTIIEDEQAAHEGGIGPAVSRPDHYMYGLPSRFRNNDWANPRYPE